MRHYSVLAARLYVDLFGIELVGFEKSVHCVDQSPAEYSDHASRGRHVSWACRLTWLTLLTYAAAVRCMILATRAVSQN
jgi:hypothetical protein